MTFFKNVQRFILQHRRTLLRHVLLSLLFLFCAMAIVGLRILYPYHFVLSLPFLVLSLRYSLVTLIVSDARVRRSRFLARIKYLGLKYEKLLLLGLFVGVFLFIIASVLPSDQHPFEGMTNAEVTMYVDTSIDVAVLHLDRLKVTGSELLDSGLLQDRALSLDEHERLLMLWDTFLLAARDSEALTDVHRYFGQISYISLRDVHTKSFVISYGLYLQKFELFGRIITAVGNNERVIKALNEHSEIFGGKNSFYDVRERHVMKETFLRRNLGRAYAWFLEQTVDTRAFGEDFNALLRAGKESYSSLMSNPLMTARVVTDTYSDNVEGALFNNWFPIQKNVADAMGKVHVSFRKTPLITREQVLTMKEYLEPGDIFVERRNWHLSTVGIPGVWPHAALHLGIIEDTALLSGKFPRFYEQYTTQDVSGYSYAVIEGQAPGIILQSLETSAMADYVGVVRPRIGKESKLLAVLRAIGNYGKPYDYNFDFETRDEIVCSELVYDAYLAGDGKDGLVLPLTLRSGRKMISPNDFVEKFYNEHGTEAQELDFVYFIDGNEALKKAFVADENAFLTTWTRSKFSSVLE